MQEQVDREIEAESDKENREGDRNEIELADKGRCEG